MFASAISGMRAHEVMFTSGANNIANANTPDFRAQAVRLEQAAQGGVQVGAIADRRGDDIPQGVSDVQLTEEIPEMIVAEIGYTANARVISTADAVSGALLDVLA